MDWELFGKIKDNPPITQIRQNVGIVKGMRFAGTVLISGTTVMQSVPRAVATGSQLIAALEIAIVTRSLPLAVLTSLSN